jgi:hypothetical protein
MRIIIDIDGDNINVTTEPQQRVVVAAATLPSGVRPTPPPAILKAAAATGAQDAGPAPAHLIGSLKPAALQAAGGPSKAGAAPSGPGRAVKKAPVKPTAKSKKR